MRCDKVDANEWQITQIIIILFSESKMVSTQREYL